MKKQRKFVSVDQSPRISDADTIEEILCLATMIASGKAVSNTWESNALALKFEDGCDSCDLKVKCLACMINE